MAYDGLLCGIIARQLNTELENAKIEKIQQPEPDEIIMQLSTKVGRKKLLISLNPQGARLHYTELTYENPKEAPNFCMLLRKHIQGGYISSVYQVETERIICFEIETINEMGYAVSKKLIAETMGKHSNLVLLDMQSGKIIDSIKRVSIDVNRYRQLLPGVVYVMPPAQDKLDFWSFEEEELRARFSDNSDTGKIVQGFGALLSSEYDTADKVVELRQNIDELKPCVYLQDGRIKEVHAVPIRSLEDCEKVEFDNIHAALDWYYSQRTETNRVFQKRDNMVRTVKNLSDKLLLKKQKLLEEIKAADEADVYRINGELINANLHVIKPGDKEVTVISYYDGLPVTIKLDEKISAAKNAQQYFKKYNKAKNSKKEKLEQLAGCEADIEYLESVISMIKTAENHEELELLRAELHEQGYLRIKNSKDRNQKFKPKPRRFTTSTGIEYVVGRNNRENDYITFKLGGKTDLWLHTKDIPGCHVVAFTGGAEPDAATVYELAASAAFFSKGKESENVAVDYVPLRYVKKPSGAKPGMVVFTNNKTVWINPKEPEKKNVL